MALINYRLRITLNDGRQMTGQMLAFDQHMNLVMADSELRRIRFATLQSILMIVIYPSFAAEEFRRLKSKSKKRKATAQQVKENESDDEDVVAAPEEEQKRTLGLIILRGESIVSLSVEGPPPTDRIAQQAPVRLIWKRRAKQHTDQPSLVSLQMQPGPGRGMPAGRGMGLAAPPGAMPPSMAGRPMAYGRPPPPMGAPPGMPGMPGMPPMGFRPPPPGFGGPPPGFPPPGQFRPPPG
jgi:small nuclear ribonucleoprotein B and B'